MCVRCVRGLVLDVCVFSKLTSCPNHTTQNNHNNNFMSHCKLNRRFFLVLLNLSLGFFTLRASNDPDFIALFLSQNSRSDSILFTASVFFSNKKLERVY